MSDHTYFHFLYARPQMKRKFVVTGHKKETREITIESSTNPKILLDAFGDCFSDILRFSYILYVSPLYDFYEVLDYLRTRQLLLNGLSEYEDMSPEPPLEEWELGTDWEPEPEEEKPFDFIAFIDALIKRVDEEMETQENQEPVFEYPDEEPEAEEQRNIFADYVEDLDPVDRMILLLVPLG